MAFQPTQEVPTYALKFWQALQTYNPNDTPDRSGIHGIERQIWSVSKSTGISFDDLCQETFRRCAEGFKAYKKSRSGLNTWIRWQARAAARDLGRQGTIHTMVDGQQATVRIELTVDPLVFSGDSDNDEEQLPYQEEVRVAISECHDETGMDNKILLDTELFSGHTVRELAEIIVKHGKTRGIVIAEKAWGCTPKKILECIQRLRDGL